MSMEKFTREVVAPAAASVIMERIISFAIDNIPWPSWGGARDAHRQRLKALLRHIDSIVEEAEGRHITNLQLLGELKSLIDTMYRGRFALEAADLDDVIKNSEISDDDAGGDDSVVTTTGKRKFALCSPFNAAKKHAQLILGSGDGTTTVKSRLASVVEELEALRGDYMRDFILLVQGYPHRRCNNVPRPLTTTLFMDRCVFGRHVETERIVAFLLQPAPMSTGLSALAVVGAKGVGKTTLVKHVCADDRVRSHFARIKRFQWWDEQQTSWQSGQTEWSEYLSGVRRILDEPRFGAAVRSLLVFEYPYPVNESAWPTLLASSNLAEGSKVLFTCCDVNFARSIGTAEPVVLRPLPEEEFWYYFKALALGGADPRDHPRITAVGRDISRHLTKSTFLDARLLGTVLRANFDARFWRRVLAAIVRCQRRPRYSLYADVLLDVLAIRGWRLMTGHWVCPPRFSQLTLQDVFRAATSSSGSGLGGSDTEEILTINYCRDTLYKDIWHTISYELLHDDNNRIN
ncbi:hypothetical protein PR202_ga18923 [Eleusine coracana subsp. coracana]|uniref:Uncharacterized protein n=1 Tax=Eleusine coracana subsp. coracana TaxID=191504 RepID=A0AAV5CUG6_ELECO|nr:hypothetical protein QOZ80_4AG0302800 [Eleusine coracana subsp. coracana]GJN01643.1 hypothetical protein PR202_ga18923 [Eleusine coracana subsp. coracana]